MVKKELILKTMAISQFKAQALKIIDTVAKTHESVIITKRGKALAELVPFHTSKNKPVPGKLSSTFVFEKDIVSPLGEKVWEACK